MLLLVDIGNSCLKWGFEEAGRLHPGGSLPHAGALPAALTDGWLASPRPSAVWVANVASPALGDSLAAWSKQHWGLTPRFAESQPALLGVRNGYQEPSRLGVDRWLALVAAYHSLGTAVLAVDCGTAATLDLVDEDGRHLGGLILPGLGMMRGALLAGTQMAVDPNFDGPAPLGTDTATCIAAGARQALTGAVERTLAQARGLLGHTPSLVLTGGDGPLLHRELGGRLEPELVLQGLALLAQEA